MTVPAKSILLIDPCLFWHATKKWKGGEPKPPPRVKIHLHGLFEMKTGREPEVDEEEEDDQEEEEKSDTK